MTILDRALRVGEGKKFKTFEKNVARINDFEPELELESRRRAARALPGAARAPPGRRVARRPAARVLRAHARGGQARPRPAPLRRPADRRHGPPRRLDRGDEDRRGQDPHGHAADRPERARLARRERLPGRGQGHPPGHGQRLPGPPRRHLDEADLRPARRDRRDHPVEAERHRQAGGLLARRRLRHELRVRLRLPARQPRRRDRAEGPARPRLRDRRRGRQHPHRRGADPADHLRPARGRRPTSTTSSRSWRRRWSRARSPRASRPSPRTTRPTSTSSRTRSTRRWRSPSAASRRPSASSASTTSTAPSTATWSTTSSRR